MAHAIGKALLGLAAVAVAASSMSAQTVQDAVVQYRTGNEALAIEILQKIVASDPSNAEAFEMWRSIDQEVWHALLVEKGELGKIAKFLVGKARVARKDMSRDASEINALVAKATSGDYGQRQEATVALISNHGEFAVPALVTKLGDSNDDPGQLYAMAALVQMSRRATLPLISALEIEDELTRRNVTATLVRIGDERAAASLAQMAQTSSSEAIRSTAMLGLENLKVTAGMSAVDLFQADAKRYLDSGNIRFGDVSDVIWTSKNGVLVAVDIPASVFNFELAKQAAHAAVALDPSDASAKSLLVRAYLGEVAAVRGSVANGSDDERLNSLHAQAPALKMVAAAAGPEVLRQAVRDSIADGMVPSAVAAIETLGNIENRDQLAGSTLVEALDHSDKRIKYAAALALTRAAGSGNVPEAGKVVANLASAVAEKAVRVVKVVDPAPETKRMLEASINKVANLAGGVVADATSAISDLYRFPNVDVVVLNEVLTNELPETLIGLIRKDPRMSETAIVVMAKDVKSATERFSSFEDIAVIPLPDSSDTLLSAVNAALEGKDLDGRRAAYEATAVQASEALRALAANKADLSGALDSLAKQLNRSDSVAVPAANALGFSGKVEQVGSLLAVAQSDSASAGLRIAAAEAIGDILGRAGSTPSDLVTGLMGLLGSDDNGLRMAAVRALGKGKLSAEKQLELIESLRTLPASSDEADG